MSASSLRGHRTLLDFWSSWCGPCQSELKTVETAWRNAPPGTSFVGVDLRDAAPDGRRALRAAHVTYPSIADPQGRIAAIYRVIGIPTIVVLDAQGRVAGTSLGPATAERIGALLAGAGR
jgi:thiol-disulfide isomerase/thioredoxin